ncbi:hypothetical protein G6O69_03695 [Pseudenhygromyxa sp. WMMC2535]|uniref:hypothetical protein n=1 Tax=Pseudenhygromyxa sp. WMMC2535 TaxID=2712867 RepID=UPI001553F2C8|nr:hypothetical protein [Pseudenhygromyxa sp. WMMC2535]NVB36919.1 hypothetical protein [Pseudenhygromyxa sp. WMMC2535]
MSTSQPAAALARPTRTFHRAPALLVGLAVIAATLWPMFRDPPKDSFPLSNYPMFSTVRATSWIHVVMGVDAEGGLRPMPPRTIGNAEVMQAAQTVRKAIRGKRADQLCTRVAETIAGDPDYAQIVRLEVQSRQFDPHTYFVDAAGREPLRVRVRARCEVANMASSAGASAGARP